ncbi:MAG: S9 family peptidase, partial [Planctomycetota bacterium]
MRSTTLLLLTCILLPFHAFADQSATPSGWQTPPEEIMQVLHAPRLPSLWSSPTGEMMLLADPMTHPPLAELAAPMHKLAGMRVNPRINGMHGRRGATAPRLMTLDGKETKLPLPEDVEVLDVDWTADGQRFALTTQHADHIGVWLGSVKGDLQEVPGVEVNGLLGAGVRWLPDQTRLLIRRVPARGAAPEPPAIPVGPEILEGRGATARSTYEARNLLETAHDDALFDYYTTSELVVLDPASGQLSPLGEPAVYTTSSFSPDGKFLLVERLVGPWSHAVPYWRFASEIEVWDADGNKVAQVASLPLADEVPTHGVPMGPRAVSWRATAPHQLYWVEALDGGDPVAEVPHRDRLMRLDAPFDGDPEEVFKAEHRITGWQGGWGAENGTLMLSQRERMRRWRYVWLLDVDAGTARPWFDLNEDERYTNPGYPVRRQLPNGRSVLHQQGNAVYFAGAGATRSGDRPFLDLRDMNTGEVQRLWRCPPDRYESFQGFVGDNEQQFLVRSESPQDVPNYYRATLGDAVDADAGEATRAVAFEPITHFEDPTPQLRQIEKRIVRYEREDGVPLSFQLHLPPGYQEGTRLPTVLYAYPLEYSDPATAGQ